MDGTVKFLEAMKLMEEGKTCVANEIHYKISNNHLLGARGSSYSDWGEALAYISNLMAHDWELYQNPPSLSKKQ